MSPWRSRVVQIPAAVAYSAPKVQTTRKEANGGGMSAEGKTTRKTFGVCSAAATKKTTAATSPSAAARPRPRSSNAQAQSSPHRHRQRDVKSQTCVTSRSSCVSRFGMFCRSKGSCLFVRLCLWVAAAAALRDNLISKALPLGRHRGTDLRERAAAGDE